MKNLSEDAKTLIALSVLLLIVTAIGTLIFLFPQSAKYIVGITAVLLALGIKFIREGK